MSGTIMSQPTEKLIEQYAYYLDGKIHLSPANVRLLEKKLKKRSFRGMGAGKLLEIFSRCAEYPNPFFQEGVSPAPPARIRGKRRRQGN
jgi:hypothetical protein